MPGPPELDEQAGFTPPEAPNRPGATGQATAQATVTACFHCGEPCGRAGVTREGRSFCCQGCLVVYDLLTGSGLGHFYDLNRHPGVRLRRAVAREQWAYLDAPEVQRRLLDFTDGQISRVRFEIPAIHCVACVWLLENLFRLHPGIGQSEVNFPRREVTIRFAAAQIPLSELVALLASIGYEPRLSLGELEKPPPCRARRRQLLQVGLAGFAFANIMLMSLPVYFGLDSWSGPVLGRWFGYLSLALALPVLIYSAADYWRAARLTFQQRVLTLDVPIALGLAALFAQSTYEIVSGRGEGYLDSLVGLVFFLLCGRLFQQKTHDQLAFDRDYKCYFPLSVLRQKPAAGAPCPEPAGAATESIALSQLQVGDRLIVRHGELIPADAILVQGPALIDYSFVTGESDPVPKEAGAYLYAGGQQLGAAIQVESVKPVSQSYLTSLWNHEAFRKDRENNLDTLTNRYSRWFTLVVVGIAAGAALAWGMAGSWGRGLQAFISVLVVACPCALALASPFTFGTAQRWLARLQVFVRNGLVLERLARVDAVVFDKTGTLTTASAGAATFHGAAFPPRWAGEHASPEPPTARPLSAAEERWVDSLTRHSTHPHAVRIGETIAKDPNPAPLEAFREYPGCGIEGEVEGHTVQLGSLPWLASRRVRVPDLVGPGPRHPSQVAGPPVDPGPNPPEPHAASGSVVGLAIDGRFRGSFALTGALRPDVDRLLHRLGARYDLTLLSGDQAKASPLFGRLFGTPDRLHFRQSPLDKLAYVRRLQLAGRTVMMVGDGLNDAGALRQSDVGVAVVERLGAFSPASDVILAADQVPQLGAILTFARQAVWIVRVSLGISALYNAVGVSIAAAGLLSPVICAVLMPASSVCVVLFACGATSWLARRALATRP